MYKNTFADGELCQGWVQHQTSLPVLPPTSGPLSDTASCYMKPVRFGAVKIPWFVFAVCPLKAASSLMGTSDFRGGGRKKGE